MDKQKEQKPVGRFQSTYSKEIGPEPKLDDYAFATRHGKRNEMFEKQSDIQHRFKFPTGVSQYKVDHCNGEPPKLENYGENKQPNNEHKVAGAPFAGYNTSYNDQNFILRHKEEIKAGKGIQHNALREISNNKPKSSLNDEKRLVHGTWNYTGHQTEDHIIQQDKTQRRKFQLYHLPGYMGHRPRHNPPTCTTFDRRTSEKEKMLLFNLDQYSRDLWPHYKGHKPQAIVNVKASPQPNKESTYGHTNYMMQKQQAWSKENRHTNTQVEQPEKKSIIKTFFTPGTSGQTSANGLTMAEKFYSFYRPLEGTLVSFQADRALASKYLE